MFMLIPRPEAAGISPRAFRPRSPGPSISATFSKVLLEFHCTRLEFLAAHPRNVNAQFLELLRGLFELPLGDAVLLADYNLGGWTAMDALEILRQIRKIDPLVVVTGALGDEAAVECVRKGAADYVLKDRLERSAGSCRSCRAPEGVR